MLYLSIQKNSCGAWIIENPNSENLKNRYTAYYCNSKKEAIKKHRSNYNLKHKHINFVEL